MTRGTTVLAFMGLLAGVVGCDSGIGHAPPDASDGSSTEAGDASSTDTGATDAATDTAGAPATAAEACTRLNEAAAERSARCLGGSLADWRALQSADQNCATFTRHVAEGLAEYQPQGWAACLEKYAAPCQESNPYPCIFEILHGKVPDGTRCEDTEVCGTVSGCLSPSGDICGEVCVRFGIENEPCGLYCGANVPCVDGAFCGADLSCVGGTCVKMKSLGEACGGPDNIPCAFPLFCDADPADPTVFGVCARRVAGAACRTDASCPSNQFCLMDTCTPRRTAGSPCPGDAPNGGCVPWTVCDLAAGQLCMPAGRIGQSCGPVPEIDQVLFYCIGGICDGTRCDPLGARGASCEQAGCIQGTSCDTSSMTCQLCN